MQVEPNFELLAEAWKEKTVILEQREDADALYELGRRLRLGEGANQDEERGWDLTKRSAEMGHPVALAICFEKGIFQEVDEKKAFLLIEEAATHDYAPAHFILGVFYYSGTGVDSDPVSSLLSFRRAADLGYAPAQYNIACYFIQGDVLDVDYDQAFHYYRLAADQNDYESIACLGWCFSNGFGVEQDTKEALRLYQQAAEHGVVFAMYNIALLYLEDSNEEEAMRYLKRAAELKNSKACLLYAKKLADKGAIHFDKVLRFLRESREAEATEIEQEIAKKVRLAVFACFDCAGIGGSSDQRFASVPNRRRNP
jgi:TPR repeat protein